MIIPFHSPAIDLAPRVGIEPTTNGLTVRCTTAVLPWNCSGADDEDRTHDLSLTKGVHCRCATSARMLLMFGATGWIRTSGFRDLQSLALGLSATVALSGTW